MFVPVYAKLFNPVVVFVHPEIALETVERIQR